MAETRLFISAKLRSVLNYEGLLAQELYGTELYGTGLYGTGLYGTQIYGTQLCGTELCHSYMAQSFMAQSYMAQSYMALCRMQETHNTINGWQNPPVPCASSRSHLMQSYETHLS